MKKLLTIAAVLLAITSCLNAKDKTQTNAAAKIISSAEQYQKYEDFEIIKVGGAALSLLKGAAMLGSDKDDKDDIRSIISMLSGIKKIAVIEYDDVTAPIKSKFNASVKKELKKENLLMEVKDEDDNIKIYGAISEDAETLNDIIFFIDSDVVICISGEIPLKDIQKFAKK